MEGLAPCLGEPYREFRVSGHLEEFSASLNQDRVSKHVSTDRKTEKLVVMTYRKTAENTKRLGAGHPQLFVN